MDSAGFGDECQSRKGHFQDWPDRGGAHRSGLYSDCVSLGVAATKAAGIGAPKRYASAWAFGPTDDVFGAALGVMARGRRFSEPAMFGLGIAADAAWLSGTAFGPMPGAAR